MNQDYRTTPRVFVSPDKLATLASKFREWLGQIRPRVATGVSRLAFPFVLWFASRVLILAWGAIAASLLPVRRLFLVGGSPTLPPSQANVVLEPWLRWDTLWYLRLAQDGYSQSDLTGGFFPLYPLLIRGFSVVVGNPLLNALLISNLCFLAALLIFYRMARQLSGEMVARRAALYWVAFPTSFYFFAGYAESVSVLFALLGIQAATRGKWLRAGVGGTLAGLARPPGFLILIPLGVEWLSSGGPFRDRIRRFLPLVLVPTGLALFMLYLFAAFGDPVYWLHAWKNVTVMPWDLVILTIKAIANGQGVGNNLVDLTLTLLVLGLTLLGFRRIPISLTAFALALILVQMMAYPPDLGFADIPMAALARRVAVIFPAFLVLAQVWHGRWKEPLWFAVSTGIQLIFISIFVRWLWLD